MRTADWALARLVLSRMTNCAFTAGMRSAKGTPRSTRTGLIASMNAARLTETRPSLTVTPSVAASPVRAATRLACASRFAAIQASSNVCEATSRVTCCSVNPWMALEIGSANVVRSTGRFWVTPSTRGRSATASSVRVVSSSTRRASKTASVMRRDDLLLHGGVLRQGGDHGHVPVAVEDRGAGPRGQR